MLKQKSIIYNKIISVGYVEKERKRLITLEMNAVYLLEGSDSLGTTVVVVRGWGFDQLGIFHVKF